MLRIVPQRPRNLSGHFYMDLPNQPDSLHLIFQLFPLPGRSAGNNLGTSKLMGGVNLVARVSHITAPVGERGERVSPSSPRVAVKSEILGMRLGRVTGLVVCSPELTVQRM